jgi:NhaA family Na+:H+ antiporter
VRTGVADPPATATRRQLVGIGTTAGIGFTVALFIAELAFTDEAHRSDAKLAILAASALAASISIVILRSERADSTVR